MRAMVCSATDSLISGVGAFVTMIPCFFASMRSILSNPTA